MYAITKKPLMIFISILILIGVFGLLSAVSQENYISYGEDNTVSLQVNGKNLKLDVPAQIVGDRTMIPARGLFEEVGGEVLWNDEERRVTVIFDKKVVVLTIDSKNASVDGITKTLDVPAQIIGDRTMIPVRFVSENLGFTVGWNDKTRTVSVKTPVISEPDPPKVDPNPPAVDPNPPKQEDPPEVEKPIEIKYNISKIGVEYGPRDNMTTKTTITFNEPINSDCYSTLSLSNNERFVIDFPLTAANQDYYKTIKSTTRKRPCVAAVRCNQNAEGTLRIVFDLNEKQTPDINLSSDGKTMTISFKKNMSYVPFNPYADGRLIVVLDPGHGKSTGGKRSPDSSLMEYEFNRAVAGYVKEILESNGIEVIMTVTNDSDPALSERCRIANSSKADIFVSIHANALGNGSDWNDANGWEIYYYEEDEEGEILAEYIHKANMPALGIKDRKIKTANFAVIKNTTMPASLIEHGFYTNLVEVELLKSDEWRRKAAQLDAQGIMNFLYSYKK